MQRLKISREGIILIKSFEGFRPHATRRDDGQWVIGYGHTLSAREGGVVSEPDAELLLQFDLIPVAKALNAVPGTLNQHQFDALASFAFSVGLDRFESSDVLSRLTSGDQGQAADAIVGWTDPTPTDTPLRRRAAERALCVADPGRPVALAELLAAPLPPPPVVVATFDAVKTPAETLAEPIAIEPAASAETAAIGSLADSAPEIEAEPAVVAETGLVPDNIPAEAEANDVATDDATELADRTEQEAALLTLETPSGDTLAAPTSDVNEDAPFAASNDPIDTMDTPTDAPPEAFAPLQIPAPIQRYAAYSATVVGPLPGMPPASWAPASSQPLRSTEALSADAVETHVDETPKTAFDTPTSPAEVADPIAAAFADPGDIAEPQPFRSSISTDAPAADGGELLVLTPLDETSIFPTQRLVWPHAEPASDQTPPLFDDDGALRLGAHQMIRHEVVSEEPRRLDWRETGLYILMGGFGLLTFGMSMAAFRRASLPSGGSEFATIAWVLAVFGFACIAVSAWNLYRKLGRPED
ncbi:hypothetical protein BH10PSE1_BH10PSE1_19340 [soil metagenome]